MTANVRAASIDPATQWRLLCEHVGYLAATIDADVAAGLPVRQALWTRMPQIVTLHELFLSMIDELHPGMPEPPANSEDASASITITWPGDQLLGDPDAVFAAMRRVIDTAQEGATT